MRPPLESDIGVSLLFINSIPIQDKAEDSTAQLRGKRSPKSMSKRAYSSFKDVSGMECSSLVSFLTSYYHATNLLVTNTMPTL